MNDCTDAFPRQWYTVTYGTPSPRYIRPLVRINGMVEDAPVGYKLDPCMLPPTIMKVDDCNQTLQVNDAMIKYSDMFQCLKLPVGSGAPTGKPAEGYYPFYLDIVTKNFYVFDSDTWYKIN